MLIGIGVGIVLTILVYSVVTFELLGSVAVGLVVVVILLLIGALVGRLIFGYWLERARKIALQEIAPLIRLLEPTFRSWLDRPGELGQATSESDWNEARMLLSYLPAHAAQLYASLRAFAWLGAVLSFTVTFAIFLATLMQVQRLEEQNRLIRQQNHLAESQRRSALIQELSNILDEVDEELDESRIVTAPASTHPATASAHSESDKEVSLSPQLTGRIVALSRSLRPYRYLNPDTGEEAAKALSPERGQLLISLVNSRINLTEIRVAGGDFSRADLQEAYLIGAPLENLRMAQADLTLANLGAARLDYTDLRGAILVAANLSGASLGETDLTEADIRYADLRDISAASVWNTELKKAKNWKQALYDPDLAKQLGLSEAQMEFNTKARDEFQEHFRLRLERARPNGVDPGI